MSRLNEKEIIKIFQRSLGNKKFVSEDVEFIKIKNSIYAITVDSLVESTEIPPKMSFEQAARKSVVSSISDFAAKGVKPLYGIISITMPKTISKSQVISISKGLSKASKEFDFKFLGGDTNEGRELSIQVFLFGIAKKIVKRKGAKLNDVIITSGPFGYSASGLKILLENKKASKKFLFKAKRAVTNPLPPLKFGLDNFDYFSSSMDSSDGLSSTLNELSRQSKKRFVVTNIPTNPDLLDFAKKNGLKSLDLVFNGGEEYEIVATVSTKNLEKIRKYCRIHKVPFFEIGHVTKGFGVVHKKNDKTKKILDKGWMHFKG